METSKRGIDLTIMPGIFAVCRFESSTPIPDWALQSGFYSISKSDEELSIVCSQEFMPSGARAELGWKCFKVMGPLDFALTGILSSLVGPLARSGISIFAISTFDTDYILVKEFNLDRAIAALKEEGHRIR